MSKLMKAILLRCFGKLSARRTPRWPVARRPIRCSLTLSTFEDRNYPGSFLGDLSLIAGLDAARPPDPSDRLATWVGTEPEETTVRTTSVAWPELDYGRPRRSEPVPSAAQEQAGRRADAGGWDIGGQTDSPAASGTVFLPRTGGQRPDVFSAMANAQPWLRRDNTPAPFSGSGETAPASDRWAQGGGVTAQAEREPTGYTVRHDLTLNVPTDRGVLADMSAPLGGPLTAELVSPPASGDLYLASDGSFSFTPATQFVGAASFAFEVFDGSTSVGVFADTVYVENRAPFAYGAEFQVVHDRTLTGQLDAQDDDGDVATFTVTQSASAGTLDVSTGTGEFTFTPPAGFKGDVTFQYKVSDGMADSQPETVTIKVTNYKPVGGADSYSVLHDRVLEEYGSVLSNDEDYDADALTAAVTTDPSHGALAFDSDGSFVYTPDAGYVGEDTFWYAANDGVEDSEPIPVEITVYNHRPRALSSLENVSKSFVYNKAVQWSDADGDEVTAELVSAPAVGSLSLESNGDFTYAHNPYIPLVDRFTFRVNDKAADSNVGTAVLRGHETEGVPISLGGAYNLTHDHSVGGMVTVYGAHIQPTTVHLAGGPSHGVLTDGLSEEGYFHYVPDYQFVGTDEFSYYAKTPDKTSITAPVVLTVHNQEPVARNEAFTIGQFGDLEVPVPGVLANDDDLDGDPVSVELISAPAVGDFSLNADGSFAYEPPVDFAGVVSFVYRITDGIEPSLAVRNFISVLPTFILGSLDIANGLEDVVPGDNPVKPQAKKTVGAASVANRNDTDNDGTPDGGDNDISVAPPNLNEGRQERDMMLVTLRKPIVIGRNPLLPATKFRAVVTAGPARLWAFHSTPDGGIDQRQSKKSGAPPATITLANFPEGVNQLSVYLEATDPSALRGITVEYQYQLPGQAAWKKLDEVKATAVWVDKQAVWKDRVVGAGATIPAGVVRDVLVDSIKQDKAADGSYFGFGDWVTKQAVPPDENHFGGRILYEYKIAPLGSEALVTFDATRQVEGRAKRLTAGEKVWTDGTPAEKKTMPKAEAVNDDSQSEDEQNDPRVKNAAGTKQANGELYSYDTPGYNTDALSGIKAAFATFRANFNEFVRLYVKGSGKKFLHRLEDAGTPAPNVQGSRASDVHKWHLGVHLKWDGTKYVKDTTQVTGSGAFFAGVGAGTMTVTTGANAETEGVKAVFDGANTKWTVTLASGPTGTINGRTGAVEFADGGGNMKYRVEIAQPGGAAAFANGDEFKASVYKTARTTKENELGEGHIAQDVTID